MTTVVERGYKQTEAGVIPTDWDVCRLGDVGKWFSGGTPSMSNTTYWDGAIPWISAKDMKVNRLFDSQDHITDKAISDGTRLMPPGTLLMVVRGMILAHTFPVARAECHLAFNQDLKAVAANGQVDSDYLLYWLMGNAPLFLGLTTESTHGTKRLPPETLFRVPFPLPARAEQEVIAAALHDADALVESLEQLVAKKRLIKQGAMQELLTGRRRLSGFSATRERKELTSSTDAVALPDIPEDWQISPLQEIGRWFSGGTPSMKEPAYWKGMLPWVSPKDMKSPRIHDTEDHITDRAIADGARLLPAGTVLLVIRGMILAHTLPVARAERPVAFNQDMKALVVRDDVDSEYVLYWLLCHSRRLLGLATESTHGTKRLPPESLYRVPFPIPPSKAEQIAIASVLSDMDAEIAALEAKLAKARHVKQGMMQELLTGRIRLV
jgi:type I restriction enzyme S subunit